MITPLKEVLLKLRREMGIKQIWRALGQPCQLRNLCLKNSGRWLLPSQPGCTSVHVPHRPPVHTSEVKPWVGIAASLVGPSPPLQTLLALGVDGQPLPPRGGHGPRADFTTCPPFSQNDLPVEGTKRSLRCTLCNLYVNEVENIHKWAADTLLQWIPLCRIWFLSEAYTDGVSAD